LATSSGCFFPSRARRGIKCAACTVIYALWWARMLLLGTGRSPQGTTAPYKLRETVQSITISRHRNKSNHVEAAEANSFASLCTNPSRWSSSHIPPSRRPCPDQESIPQTPKAKYMYTIPTLKSETIHIHPFSKCETSSQTTKATPLVNKLLDCLERLSKGMLRMC
jgi:hypothetical protein